MINASSRNNIYFPKMFYEIDVVISNIKTELFRLESLEN